MQNIFNDTVTYKEKLFTTPVKNKHTTAKPNLYQRYNTTSRTGFGGTVQ
jgi:hypothetical protein